MKTAKIVTVQTCSECGSMIDDGPDQRPSACCDKQPCPGYGLSQYAGKNVIVRTVTYHFTGHLTAVEDGFLVLDDAAWIADSGRWGTALKSGMKDLQSSEIEPYPGRVLVAIASIVDISEWKLVLPREQK